MDDGDGDAPNSVTLWRRKVDDSNDELITVPHVRDPKSCCVHEYDYLPAVFIDVVSQLIKLQLYRRRIMYFFVISMYLSFVVSDISSDNLLKEFWMGIYGTDLSWLFSLLTRIECVV